MDLGEAWRTSKVAYTELVYRPILKSGYAPRDMGSTKSVRRALTGASLNKLIFAFFTMAGAVFPFVLFRLGQETRFALRLASISLTMAVALSVLLVFGYIVLYCVQVLPSFVSSGSFAPLAQLPVASRDVSKVAGMTLFRALDYILIVSCATQLAAVAYFTGSIPGVFLALFASVSGSLLAVGLALWLTSLFQRRLESGSMVGFRSFFRPLYFILWGLGVMSAVFLFSIISYVALPLEAALSDPSSPVGFALSLILPFSVGVLTAHFQGQGFAFLSLVLASAGVAIAALASVRAWTVISRVIGAVVLPAGETSSVATRSGLSFRVRSPLSAYVLKDIRVSSRNPATGFLFALPLFEIIAVVVPITAVSVVRMSVLLVGAQVGAGFALFVAFLLVTVEDLGIERRTALPFSESVRTLSKVVVSSAAYLPVPFALAAALVGKTSTFDGGVLVPFVTIASVFCACVFEVSVLKSLADAGWGTAMRFAAGVGAGEFVILLPAVLYSVEYFSSHSHVWALEAFVAATILEVAAASVLLVMKGRTGRRRINSVRPLPATS